MTKESKKGGGLNKRHEEKSDNNRFKRATERQGGGVDENDKTITYVFAVHVICTRIHMWCADNNEIRLKKSTAFGVGKRKNTLFRCSLQ